MRQLVGDGNFTVHNFYGAMALFTYYILGVHLSSFLLFFYSTLFLLSFYPVIPTYSIVLLLAIEPLVNSCNYSSIGQDLHEVRDVRKVWTNSILRNLVILAILVTFKNLSESLLLR